jgi:hypothetical protein
MTSRPSTAAPILAVLAIVLATLLATYVGGYLWLGEYHAWTSNSVPTDTSVIRLYDSRWQAALFKPAAAMESLVYRQRVAASWPANYDKDAEALHSLR